MDDPDPTIGPLNRTGGDSRTASGAIEFAAIALGAFGAVTLCNAAVGIASVLGLTDTAFLQTYSLATLGFTGRLTLAVPALVLGSLDLVAALGVYRLREWAYWAGVALLGLHTVLGMFANPLFTILGLCFATVLGVQKRTYTRSFE